MLGVWVAVAAGAASVGGCGSGEGSPSVATIYTFAPVGRPVRTRLRRPKKRITPSGKTSNG
jgi:hypothetical protein